MQTKYSTMILKPYIKSGVPCTDYYSAYGMDSAVIVTDNNNGDGLADLDVESVVAVDVCDFSYIAAMKKASKICIIFTKKLRQIVNIELLYSMNIHTLLLSDSSYNINAIDIARFPHLICLKTRKDAVDLSCLCTDLITIELNNISGLVNMDFINNLPQLKKLSLEGGILEFNETDCANKLESLTVKKSKITNHRGLAKFRKLKQLSLNGIFDADIINELSHIQSLEYLCLDCYVEIDNVDWVNNLPNLKIIILGCVIRNGDTSPLVALRHARLKVDCANYKFRDADLPKDFALVKSFE